MRIVVVLPWRWNGRWGVRAYRWPSPYVITGSRAFVLGLLEKLERSR